MSRDFDQALTEAGIPHVYEEYVGDHSDKWSSRLYIALPFLSDFVSSDTVTSIHPRVKLAVTWAPLKVNTE